MKKIAIVTATRAEYGLLTPLIQKILDDKDFILDLIVTGAHLSDKQGRTVNAVREDGFPVTHEIPILEDGGTSYDISLTIANAARGFAACFRDDRPDIAVILGDRTEMLGVAVAAINERIPIAHIHGGEVTEGAVDDCIRHALTKMSYLHFTAAEAYRQRVIQLGEDPGRVFNAGSLGTENILHVPLMKEDEIRSSIGIPKDKQYVVVTFHPVTLEDSTAEEQTKILCSAVEQEEEYFYLFTKANADAGGHMVNSVIEDFTKQHNNTRLASSLGMKRYLSAVKYAAFVLGNSSSGISEAPVLGTPTVNIGDRQKGRIMAKTVINCEPDKDKIIEAMCKTKEIERKSDRIYGDGHTSDKIVRIIKSFLMNHKINLKKGFYDLTANRGESN